MVLGVSFFKHKHPIAYIKTSYGTLGMNKPEINIGRNKDNDIVLSDPWVSRQHSTITFDIKHCRFLYRDHSTNGTNINGELVHNKNAVLPNLADIAIRAGSQITRMRFHSSSAALIDTDHKVHVIPIDKEFLLGREGLHEIPWEYGYVSRKHAVIKYDARSRNYILIDHSKNGTYIGKEKIHNSHHILQDSDKISLALRGYNYTFRHFYQEPINNLKDKVVEPQQIGETEWQKLTEGGDKGGWDVWTKFYVGLNIDQAYTSWKFHVYADEEDICRMGKVLISELKNKKLTFKTIKEINLLQKLSSEQKGKAFTVYICSESPTDIRRVRTTARAYFNFIHGLLNKPEIRTKGKHIEGDRQVPGDRTGRIFYRYDGEIAGPGPKKGYRNNEMGSKHNIPDNPDIF